MNKTDDEMTPEVTGNDDSLSEDSVIENQDGDEVTEVSDVSLENDETDETNEADSTESDSATTSDAEQAEQEDLAQVDSDEISDELPSEEESVVQAEVDDQQKSDENTVDDDAQSDNSLEQATVETAVEETQPATKVDEPDKPILKSKMQPDITETEESDENPAEETAAVEDDGREWYVIHCYSGYENKVRHNLEQRIETMGMKDSIFDVVVPTEEEIEVKDGKRRTVERRVFPGYILVNMTLGEESWYVVRNTPGVTSFVGMGEEPIPLRPEEVSQIIKRMESDAPRIKVTFKQGERVRIVDGPFNDFRGTVEHIDMERAKVRVMVNFFGRETPVELDFLQVEKT